LKLKIAAIAMFVFAAHNLSADEQKRDEQKLIIGTMQNGSPNVVSFFDARTGSPVSSVNTAEGGNVSGNAGGLVTCGDGLIAVDHDGKAISVFEKISNVVMLTQNVTTQAGPQSISCDEDHVVVLEDTLIESFPLGSSPYFHVATTNDGMVATGGTTPAQVMVVGGRAYFTEKAGQLFWVSLGDHGVSGSPVQIPLPANASDTPFALAVIPDRPNPKLVVAAAHSARLLLFDATTGELLSNAPSNLPFPMSAPCWLAVYGEGPFQLFSGDSPQSAVTAWSVTDQTVQFEEVAATLGNSPTDIAIRGNTLAVIQPGSGKLSVFRISPAGRLDLRWSTVITAGLNGVAVW
jgi:hypothetical protein